MSKTELRKEFEVLVKKLDIQKNLLVKKVQNVDIQKSASDSAEYENFMPLIEEFQNDLDFIHNQIYNLIDNLNDSVIKMYDDIEKAFNDIPDEDFDAVGENGELIEDDIKIEDGDVVFFDLEVEGPDIEDSDI